MERPQNPNAASERFGKPSKKNHPALFLLLPRQAPEPRGLHAPQGQPGPSGWAVDIEQAPDALLLP